MMRRRNDARSAFRACPGIAAHTNPSSLPRKTPRKALARFGSDSPTKASCFFFSKK
jgi:hypothetical protein